MKFLVLPLAVTLTLAVTGGRTVLRSPAIHRVGVPRKG